MSNYKDHINPNFKNRQEDLVNKIGEIDDTDILSLTEELSADFQPEILGMFDFLPFYNYNDETTDLFDMIELKKEYYREIRENIESEDILSITGTETKITDPGDTDFTEHWWADDPIVKAAAAVGAQLGAAYDKHDYDSENLYKNHNMLMDEAYKKLSDMREFNDAVFTKIKNTGGSLSKVKDKQGYSIDTFDSIILQASNWGSEISMAAQYQGAEPQDRSADAYAAIFTVLREAMRELGQSMTLERSEINAEVIKKSLKKILSSLYHNENLFSELPRSFFNNIRLMRKISIEDDIELSRSGGYTTWPAYKEVFGLGTQSVSWQYKVSALLHILNQKRWMQYKTKATDKNIENKINVIVNTVARFVRDHHYNPLVKIEIRKGLRSLAQSGSSFSDSLRDIRLFYTDFSEKLENFVNLFTHQTPTTELNNIMKMFNEIGFTQVGIASSVNFGANIASKDGLLFGDLLNNVNLQKRNSFYYKDIAGRQAWDWSSFKSNSRAHDRFYSDSTGTNDFSLYLIVAGTIQKEFGIQRGAESAKNSDTLDQETLFVIHAISKLLVDNLEKPMSYYEELHSYDDHFGPALSLDRAGQIEEEVDYTDEDSQEAYFERTKEIQAINAELKSELKDIIDKAARFRKQRKSDMDSSLRAWARLGRLSTYKNDRHYYNKVKVNVDDFSEILSIYSNKRKRFYNSINKLSTISSNLDELSSYIDKIETSETSSFWDLEDVETLSFSNRALRERVTQWYEAVQSNMNDKSFVHERYNLDHNFKNEALDIFMKQNRNTMTKKNSIERNKKILSIGIPTGLLDTLSDYDLFDGVGEENDTHSINNKMFVVKVHKRHYLDDSIRYNPKKFYFPLSPAVKFNDFHMGRSILSYTDIRGRNEAPDVFSGAFGSLPPLQLSLSQGVQTLEDFMIDNIKVLTQDSDSYSTKLSYSTQEPYDSLTAPSKSRIKRLFKSDLYKYYIYLVYGIDLSVQSFIPSTLISESIKDYGDVNELADNRFDKNSDEYKFFIEKSKPAKALKLRNEITQKQKFERIFNVLIDTKRDFAEIATIEDGLVVVHDEEERTLSDNLSSSAIKYDDFFVTIDIVDSFSDDEDIDELAITSSDDSFDTGLVRSILTRDIESILDRDKSFLPDSTTSRINLAPVDFEISAISDKDRYDEFQGYMHDNISKDIDKISTIKELADFSSYFNENSTSVINGNQNLNEIDSLFEANKHTQNTMIDVIKHFKFIK